MKHLLFFLLLIITSNLSAQKWEHTFGLPNRDDYGIDVVETYDNGYLIMGAFEGEYSWLIKTDVNGEILWHKYFKDEDPYLDIFINVLCDEEGNIYLLGWRVIQFVDGWPQIVKLNACGEPLWCRQYIDEDYWWGWFQDAMLLEDGNILGMSIMADQEQIDMVYLYNISPEGELNWRKSYASKNNHPLIHSRSPIKMELINDMYIISGYCYYAYPNNPPHGYLRPMFIGIDSLFEEKFVMPFGMADSLTGKACSSISINDTLIMGVGQHWLLAGSEIYDHSLLMFYDTDGNEVYHKDIPNSAIDTTIKGNWIRDIKRINDTLFYTSAYFGEQYEGNDNGEFIIDTFGNVYRHSLTPNTVANSRLIKTYDNKYLKAGSIKSGDWDIWLTKKNDTLGSDTMNYYPYKYDSLCPGTIYSDTLDLSGCLITTGVQDFPNIQEADKKYPELEICPNPAQNEVNCQLSIVSCQLSMLIYDLYGRVIEEKNIPAGQTQTSLDISNYPPGVYLAVLKDETGIVARGKFVKR